MQQVCLQALFNWCLVFSDWPFTGFCLCLLRVCGRRQSGQGCHVRHRDRWQAYPCRLLHHKTLPHSHSWSLHGQTNLVRQHWLCLFYSRPIFIKTRLLTCSRNDRGGGGYRGGGGGGYGRDDRGYGGRDEGRGYYSRRDVVLTK